MEPTGDELQTIEIPLEDEGDRPRTQNVLSALDAWKAFGLDARRAELDSQGLEIADNQQVSINVRKTLADHTKTFKKNVTDAGATPVVTKLFGGLLKEYQSEIDRLTSRAKLAENSFLNLYRALYDTPDPVPIIENEQELQINVKNLEAELKMLAHERDTYHSQATNASAYEKQVQTLQDQLASMEAKFETKLKASINEKQEVWMDSQRKAIEAYEMREQELLHQIAAANKTVRNLQNSQQALEFKLSEALAQKDQSNSTEISQIQMITEEMDQARNEVVILRKRIQDLESEKGVGFQKTVQGTSSMELAAKDVHISQLKSQIASLEKALNGENEEKAAECLRLTKLIQEKDNKLLALEESLKDLPTSEEYQSMKAELDTITSLQLNDGKEVKEGDRSVPLEKRLMDRVKMLEGRSTKLRVDLDDRVKELQETKAAVTNMEEVISDQKALINRLEDTLSKLTAEKGDAAREEDGTNANWGNWGEQQASGDSIYKSMRDEPSMLDIITGQRNRFRARVLELEEDNQRLMERIEKQIVDTETLKNDNVKLYEKIRYLQTMTKTESSVSLDMEDDHNVLMNKYKQVYEDIVNPFTLFNRRERNKRMGELSTAERITIHAGQKVLSTKISRLFIFGYFICLHLLVFVVLSFARSSCDSLTKI